MKFCIHCGKRVLELLHPFLNGGPVHNRCFSSVQKDSTTDFKRVPALVEDQKGAFRLRLVPGKVV